jgi:hypothetical protein
VNRCGDDQDEYPVSTESETAETVQRLSGAEREKTTWELTLERAVYPC